MSTGGSGGGAGGGARPPPRIDGMVSLKASIRLESTATRQTKWRPAITAFGYLTFHIYTHSYMFCKYIYLLVAGRQSHISNHARGFASGL